MKKRNNLACLVAMLFIVGSACKDKSAAPKPKPATNGTTAGGTTGETTGGETTGETTGGETTGGESEAISIEPEGSSEDFKYKVGDSVSIKFKIDTVLSSSGVLVGLSELPDGATMVKSGKTVTFSWSASKAGTHAFRFLLRDKSACESQESDAGKCEISESDYGELTEGSYDTQSERYSLVVTDSNTTTNTNTGTGNNQQIIQQIAGLLTGGGGGDLTQILGGLSGGQLQQLLGLVQNGGSGLDINTLLTLVQGITLRGQETPGSGQVETLPPKAQ